jgi:hypothetical protein
MTRSDLLGEDAHDLDVLDGPIVRTLLDGPLDVQYKKWQGAHWRLVSLAELEIPPGEPRALAGADLVLDCSPATGIARGLQTIDGLTPRCASQEGNALAACCRRSARRAARELTRQWQWPDGGWTCESARAATARPSMSRSRPQRHRELAARPMPRSRSLPTRHSRSSSVAWEHPLIAIRRLARSASVTCSRCAWTPAS